MSSSESNSDKNLFDRWRLKIEIADRHNILCHCRQCGQEWVTSTRDASCRCGSRDIESIPCWQFPDG
ncbi:MULTISPECIES: hypothetical protein [Spirulina sp. CCY15215]|uniref:hypothetical protein n=1 Tax=Spirulina sp. CCY15215 TaxID=2767591 RepID=UPI0019520306